MADTTVKVVIDVVSKGGQKVIDGLTRALQTMKRVADEATDTRKQVTAARAAANALRQQLLAEQDLLRQRIENHAKAKQLLADAVADQKKHTDNVITGLKKEQALRESVFSRAREEQQRRVKEARAAVTQEIADQKKLIAGVKEAAQKKLDAERDIQRKANDAARETTLAALKRQTELQQAGNRERRRINAQIELEKRIRDEQKKRLEGAIAKGPSGAREAQRLQRDVAFSRQIIADLRTERREAKETQDQRLAGQKELVQNAKDSAKVIKGIRAESVKSVLDQGKREIADAKTLAEARVTSRRTSLQDAKDELAKRTENFNKLRAQGRANVIAARNEGKTAVETARTANKAAISRAATEIRESRKVVASKKVQTLSAEQGARAQERAAARAAAALQGQSRAVPGLTASYQKLRNVVLQLVAAYQGFKVLRNFIATGFEFNALIESSRLGIAALITAQADLIDNQGKMLTGTEALAAAQGIAARQLDKLRVAGIQTIATTEELVQTFQETVGAGLNVGLTLDQIRKFSVLVAQAGAAINLPMNQLQQESRSILSSTIDRNSRLAKTLNITNAIVNQAKAEGKLFELLNQRFAAFNVAGIESVKTWNALVSNIKDAFAVLAGISTKPLFESLRKAGQEALARIFDFDTAEIRANFRGLIEGLQILFGQIGEIFRVALKKAVDAAEDLSKWIRANRAEVQKTAGAIATMVAEFGKMIVAIVSGVGEMLSLGRSTNTVIGAARTLTALFRAIAENVKIIVALLGSAVLIGSLQRIIQTIALLRLAGAGAAGATALGFIPGVGQLLAVIIGLATAYQLLKGAQQDVAVETARLGDQFHDQHLRAAELTASIIAIEAELAKTKPGTQERADLEKEWANAQDELRKLGPQYKKVIDDNTESIAKQREELIKLLKVEASHLALQMSTARITLNMLRQRKEELKREAPSMVPEFGERGDFSIKALEKHEAELKSIDDQIKVMEASADATTNQYLELIRVITKLLAPPEIRQRPGAEEPGGEPQFIKQARANLERVKAEIEARQAEARARFAQGSITHIEMIETIAEQEKRALDAERELIEAIRLKATQDLAKAEKGKTKEAKDRAAAARDQIAAQDIALEGLVAKRLEIDANLQKELLDSARETAEAREQIEINSLKDQGKILEAAQRQIRLDQQKDIVTAIQQFGQGLATTVRTQLLKATGPELIRLLELYGPMIQRLAPELFKVKLHLDVEGAKAELDAIEDLVRQAEEQRNREVEATRARFDALKTGRKGGLSEKEKQDQVTEIAAINARAEKALATLRERLTTLRAEFETDPLFAGMIPVIDALLARLDSISAKAQDIDLEMRKLAQTLEESMVESFQMFFETLGTGSKKAKELFHDMAKGIIDDMRRIVAEIIARRITTALLTALGVASGAAGGGQAVGNTTQSGGRAAGGLAQGRMAGGIARPQHGVLHGGVRGRDSIPILAMADEYFVKRRATQYYGADFLDLINQMRLPLSWTREAFSVMRSHWTPRPVRPRHHFASGGAVQGRSATARPAVRQEVHHVIGVSEDGLLGFLEGPGGRSITLSHVGSAPRFIDRQLNGRKKRVV